jgi:hypothetical protein
MSIIKIGHMNVVWYLCKVTYFSSLLTLGSVKIPKTKFYQNSIHWRRRSVREGVRTNGPDLPPSRRRTGK